MTNHVGVLGVPLDRRLVGAHERRLVVEHGPALHGPLVDLGERADAVAVEVDLVLGARGLGWVGVGHVTHS